MAGADQHLPLAEAPWRPRVNPWVVALTVTLATFMEVLDTSIANVALPHIAGGLAAGFDESTWVLTSYLVSNAIILPMSGWFSSLMGRKRFYMTCVALFTLSSLACALAPTLEWLVFFRVLQGLGGGGLQPSEQAILADTFEPRRRGMAFAVYGMAVVTAPALGPTIGGWITDNFDWRWIFLINIPVGLLAMGLSGLVLEDPPHARKRKRGTFTVDYIGFGLIALGLGTLQVVLDKGEREDWFGSRFIVIFTAICVVSLVAAVIWELKHEHPIVELRLLAERNFGMANLLMFTLGFVLLGSTVMLPQMLQQLMGYTAMQAGLALLPGGLLIICILPFVGFLLGRGVQPRWMVAFGFAVSAMGIFWMSSFNLQVDFRTAVMARVVQAAGMAFLFVPINTISYARLPKEKNNAASGLVNLSRNIGASVGIAWVTTMIARRAQAHNTVLVGHATPYDWGYVHWLAQVKQALMNQGVGAYEAGQMALGKLYAMIQQQAAMLAFVDTFKLLGIIFLCVIPLVLVMRPIPRGGAAITH